MARIVIIADHDSSIAVELRQEEISENLVVEDLAWAGGCAGPGCTWHLVGAGEAQIGAPGSAQPFPLVDVIQAASDHVDSHPVPHPVVRRLADLAHALDTWCCRLESRQVAALAGKAHRGKIAYTDVPAALRALQMSDDAGQLVDRALDDVDDLATS